MNKMKKNQKLDNNPTLSLCMIVKNEEYFLPMCLDSVKDYIDEIVIVDTGSTDKTIEIAESYNAKIYHHPWENSFSKARNYSLKYATSDWILILDADEEIDKEDAHRLKEVIKDPLESEASQRVDLIFIPVYSKFNNGKNLSIANSERLFRNHLGICYDGIVHNTLRYSAPTRKENIRLHHHGYNQDNEQMERKFLRTSTLLKEQIKNDPENPVPHHNLAVSFLDRNMNSECIKEALEAIRLFELQNSDSQLRLLSYYSAGVAFYRINELSNAKKYAIKSLSFYSEYVDAYCLLSSIYFLQKEYDKCIETTKKYLDLLPSIESDPNSVLSIPYNTLQHAGLAYSRMAIIFLEQGHEPDGLLAFKNAVNSSHKKWEPYINVSRHFAEHGNSKLAEKFLTKGIKLDPCNRHMLYYASEFYENSGASDKALNCLKAIIYCLPDETQAIYKMGLLLMKKNQYDEAIKSFKAVTDKEPEHFNALFNMAIAYEGIGNTNKSKEIYNVLTKKDPNNPEVRLRQGSLFLNENDYTRAKEYFSKLLNTEKYLIEAHLGLSKIALSMNDPESCIKSCDELLKHLNLPRDITINNISELSELYIQIGIVLLREHKEHQVKFSFKIAELLKPGIIDNLEIKRY
ncbi:glycosyltransferase [Candidatus Scalindua japonica]|uniref:Glycosyltransferase n=1 Tax=Candidatus Scalindua japonica TaxID=1284222 RepID=A0A286TVU7_9BACT|nr:TPR domain-containing glycosyltransferase [Candidatus Scalindua japonica]GAX60017.1 glycosyltransferase [Candidatus Scalindua japonica]